MYTWSNRGRPVVPKRVQGPKLSSMNNTRGLNLIPGTVRVGKGEHGFVNMYMNSTRKKYARKVQDSPVDNEIRLMRKIKKIVPTSVPTVYKGSAGVTMITNYAPGGDLEHWIRANKNRLTQQDIELIILQVLKILYKISKFDPSFRHNDLHVENILVDDDRLSVRLLISDFGLACDAQYPAQHDKGYAETLRTQYGIFKGNHKLYDALTFLQSMYTLPENQFPALKRKIRSLMLGIPLKYGRPAFDAKISLTFSDLIRAFVKPVSKTRSAELVNMNLSSFFKSPPKSQANQIRALRIWTQGKSCRNRVVANLRKMFPNVKNVNFMKIVGFIPKKNSRNVNLPKCFTSPKKLRNAATLGESRFKTRNIKKASPKRISPKRVQKVAPWVPNKNLKTLRPVNIEQFFKKSGKSNRNARNQIERIVRNARSGKLQAWEKAKIIFGNQISISSSSSSSPKA